MSVNQDSQSVKKQITYRNFPDFLSKHYKQKDSTLAITHTRIGSEQHNIKGGSYHIDDSELEVFWKLYYRDVVSKGNPEYLTEKQRESGPIAVDLDFRYSYVDVTTRQHDKDMIEDLVDTYLDETKKMFQYDDETDFPIFVFEKPDVNRLEQKKITKDGIHLIIGIQADRPTQIILRERVIEEISKKWKHLPITNDWNSVFDQGISAGTTNWQLFGSRKPDNQQYQLTYMFNINYDTSDGEFQRRRLDVSSFDVSKKISMLSVRYTKYTSYFMKNDFLLVYNEYKRLHQGGKPISNVLTISRSMNPNFTDSTVQTIRRIKCKEEAQTVLDLFLDSIKATDYELKEAYQYAMALPNKYYDQGSYDKWMRVGWALKNIGYCFKRSEQDALLIVWIVFSAQAKNFNYLTQVPDLVDRWVTMNPTNKGLTKRSLMYWAKEDAYEEYKKIRLTSIDYFVEMTLNSSCSNVLSTSKSLVDNDVAEILYQMFKDEYTCVDYKSNLWYRFVNHRWIKNDSGVSLSIAISTDVKDLYIRKREATAISMEMNSDYTPGYDTSEKDSKDDKNNPIKKRLHLLVDITAKLGMNAEKRNIMSQAKEKFWDTDFVKKLDTNPDLICFSNGVVDFKTKTFRNGLPEDYITLCTNINYIDINKDYAKYEGIVNEINEFMQQLFPEKELREYMWDHLASTMTGYTKAQTFNMYIGIGRNGKSVLVNLMSRVLGDYKEDAPVTLLTGPPPNACSATPALMNLKGRRLVVMQEPTKGDKINDGTMKLFTSGLDPISGRQLYGTTETFYPQMKLVVCSNIMLEVKTDDHGTWRRIRVVPYKSLFTENPVSDDPDKPYQFKVDFNMTEKFDEWKEVFASMLVNRVFQTNGDVKDCDIVMAASNKYRESQDYIAEFFRDCLIQDPSGKVKKTELNNQFKIWYEMTYGRCGVSPKDIHENMDKRFGSQKNGCWLGIRIRYERDDQDIPDDLAGIEDDISIEDL